MIWVGDNIGATRAWITRKETGKDVSSSHILYIPVATRTFHHLFEVHFPLLAYLVQYFVIGVGKSSHVHMVTMWNKFANVYYDPSITIIEAHLSLLYITSVNINIMSMK